LGLLTRILPLCLSSEPLCRAPLKCSVALALRCGSYHAPVRIYRDKPVHPDLVVPRRVILASPILWALSSCIYLPGVSNEPNLLLRCCTFPSTLSQRCMPLFDSHLADSAGAASATPGGPLSSRAGCPPSLSCPFWASWIAARQVTPASLARPALQL
jgi:hypothetical protein